MDWLNLYFAYYLLLDPRGLTEFDAATWDMRAAMEHSLEDIWRQSAGTEMVECSDDVRVGIGRYLKLVHTSKGPLTTRVLFECAAVLDELFRFEGAFMRKTGPALHDFLLEVLNGENGIPDRLARVLAGRDLVLNPVVLGLHPEAPPVDWKELYPPYRFAAAAKATAGWETDLEFQHSSHEATVHFQHMLAKRSGLRMGSVASCVRPLHPLGSRQAAIRAFPARPDSISLVYHGRVSLGGMRMLRGRRIQKGSSEHSGVRGEGLSSSVLRAWVETGLVLAVCLVAFGLLGVMPKPSGLDLAVGVSVVLCFLGVMGHTWGMLPQWRLKQQGVAAADGVGEQLVAAREDERSRLRTDLHDSLGPALAGIRLRLDVAAERVAQPGTRQLILDAAAETARTVDDIRRIIDDLCPPDLDGGGIHGALRRLAHRASVDGKLDVRVELREPEPARRLSFAIELAAYRIASESLTNVLRHAGARTVTVRLTDQDGWLTLEVTDDGSGPPGAGACRRGVGLASMAHRAQDVGGRCEVLPRPDGRPGTLVRARLPRSEA
ncbi:sensor histidine kinase [Streptomyces albogriseolus]|uniref:sensor histidine kinase n=1 Tax=Streptomyces albogriseolus TaxID=1887 RepID=UPI0034604228